MMIRLLFALFSSFLLLHNAALASDEIKHYQPHSPWNIHYGEDSCDLKRIFKSGEEEAQLQITQSFDISGGTLYLVVKPISKKRFWESMFRISIEETGAELSKEGRFLRIRDKDLLVWQIYGFETVFLENLPNEVTLRLKGESYPDVSLKLTGMEAVDDALKKCQRNLFEMFGLDYSEMESLSRQPSPRGYPGRWANAYDYPASSLRRGHEGTVRFMVSVDAKGNAEKCTILKSSGYKELDNQACKVLNKRARFSPALDKAGKPIKANWISAVRWSIPR